MNAIKIYLLFFLTLILLNINAHAQKKQLICQKITSPPTIDGFLGDSVWLNKPVATDFIQLDPDNGTKANFKTDVKIVYDNDAIYIGVMMYDNAPDSIYKQLSQRDEIYMSDFFGIYIDPFNTGLVAYGFFVTSAGVQIDMKVETFEDASWDAVWYSKVKIIDDGWSCEMKIPYSAIRFSSEEKQTWGINMFRNIQRRREKITWNFIDKKIEGIITQSGELTGIENIVPPLRLSFMPYFSNYFQYNSEHQSWTRSTRGGMDLKYGINKSFTIDMMLIPDFGQVQSDDQVLNISPFETYYSEKRQFFTEGTELFNKANIFYSRRIGGEPKNYYQAENELKENEKIISNVANNQLINATKITGRTNKSLGIGFLNAITLKSFAIIEDTITKQRREFTTQYFTNYNVLVFDQSLKNNSYISLINTNVTEFQTQYLANVTATDFKFYNKNKTYAIGGNSAVSQIHDSQDSQEYGATYTVFVSKTSQRFRFDIYHFLETDKYNPNDMGYLQMNNAVGGFIDLAYNFYNPIWKFIWWRNNVNITYESLYKPLAYNKLQLSTSNYVTFKNYITLGINSAYNLLNEHDYFETRVENRYFEVPNWYYFQLYLSTDYRKPIAMDIIPGIWRSTLNDFNGYWITFIPRFKINDRMLIVHNITINNEIKRNYVTHDSENEIYFGKDLLKNISNTLEIGYIFNNKQGINIRARHYLASVDFTDFYFLTTEGQLFTTNNSFDNYDINFNIFNIDFIYNWNFAHGSEMSVAWKNIINAYDEKIITSFHENIKHTLESPQINDFSLKIIYYLDYQYMKKNVL